MFYNIITFIKSPFFVKREIFYNRFYPSYFLFKFFSLFFKISLSKDWLVKDEKISLYYYLNSDIGRYLFIHGSFEQNDVNHLLSFLNKSKPIILDIGANIGTFSIKTAKEFNQAIVYSFEPGRLVRNILHKNLTLNGLNNRVFVENVGVSNVCGSYDFHESSDSAYSSIKFPNRKEVFDTYTIDIRSLDFMVFQQLELKSVDVIKIDVEGLELNVLKGAIKVITNFRPLIMIELFKDNSSLNECEQAFELLQSFRYKAYGLCLDGDLLELENYSADIYNYLFKP